MPIPILGALAIRWGVVRAASWLATRSAVRTGLSRAGGFLKSGVRGLFSTRTAAVGGLAYAAGSRSANSGAGANPWSSGTPRHSAPMIRPRSEGGGDTTNKLFGLDTGLRLLDRITGKEATLPRFAHTIEVTVKGGPMSDLRRMYYLALSAAFGRWVRGASKELAHTILQAHIDVTGKAVNIVMGYTCQTAVTAIRNGVGGAISGNSPLRVIQTGPDQVTIGGSWPTFLRTVAGGDNSLIVGGGLGAVAGLLLAGSKGAVVGGGIGLLTTGARAAVNSATSQTEYLQGATLTESCGTGPVAVFPLSGEPGADVFRELPKPLGSTADAGVTVPWGQQVGGQGLVTGYTQFNGQAPNPDLPDTARVITTGEKNHPEIQPPKPPVDGVLRGSLALLVAQALATPCFLPQAPPCNGNPRYTPGAKINRSLTKWEPERLFSVSAPLDPDNIVLTLPAQQPGTDGDPDGYVVPPQLEVLPSLRTP